MGDVAPAARTLCSQEMLFAAAAHVLNAAAMSIMLHARRCHAPQQRRCAARVAIHVTPGRHEMLTVRGVLRDTARHRAPFFRYARHRPLPLFEERRYRCCRAMLIDSTIRVRSAGAAARLSARAAMLRA